MYFSLFLASMLDTRIDSLQEHAGINLRESFDSPLWTIVQSLSAADSINYIRQSMIWNSEKLQSSISHPYC